MKKLYDRSLLLSYTGAGAVCSMHVILCLLNCCKFAVAADSLVPPVQITKQPVHLMCVLSLSTCSLIAEKHNWPFCLH